MLLGAYSPTQHVVWELESYTAAIIVCKYVNILYGSSVTFPKELLVAPVLELFWFFFECYWTGLYSYEEIGKGHSATTILPLEERNRRILTRKLVVCKQEPDIKVSVTVPKL